MSQIQTINTVQGNTAPALGITAKRAGVVIDVTGATVDLIIARGSTVVNTGHTACTLVTPISGLVSYTPGANDFISPGTYKADLRITYAGDGSVETLYDQLKIKVRKHL
jgi:hypothetical protein